VNGSIQLDTTKVHSDRLGNTLLGGVDALDLFFANNLDLLSDVNQPTGEIGLLLP
jgi:hypothetical protein